MVMVSRAWRASATEREAMDATGAVASTDGGGLMRYASASNAPGVLTCPPVPDGFPITDGGGRVESPCSAAAAWQLMIGSATARRATERGAAALSTDALATTDGGGQGRLACALGGTGALATSSLPDGHTLTDGGGVAWLHLTPCACEAAADVASTWP